MSGYVDIHAHVLPGIDDGPSDLEGALAMLRAAAESGTTTIASTPHLRSDYPDVHVNELAQRCQALREEIARAGIERHSRAVAWPYTQAPTESRAGVPRDFNPHVSEGGLEHGNR